MVENNDYLNSTNQFIRNNRPKSSLISTINFGWDLRKLNYETIFQGQILVVECMSVCLKVGTLLEVEMFWTETACHISFQTLREVMKRGISFWFCMFPCTCIASQTVPYIILLNLSSFLEISRNRTISCTNLVVQ